MHLFFLQVWRLMRLFEHSSRNDVSVYLLCSEKSFSFHGVCLAIDQHTLEAFHELRSHVNKQHGRTR